MGRIVFILHTTNLRGGAEMSALELIKDVSKTNTVIVILPGEGKMDNQLKKMNIKTVISRYYYWDRNSPEESQVNQDAILDIYETITKYEATCVITNTLMIPWGAIAASYANIPHIWLAREMLVYRNKHMEGNYKFIDNYSNLILANSKSNAEYIKTKTKSDKIRNFYSYVDPNSVSLGSKISEPRLAVIASNISQDKNQLEVIEAVAELKKKLGVQQRLILIGDRKDTEYASKIDNIINNSQLQNQVSFTGFTNDPFSLLGKNDILIQPSKHESLGRVIIEAMLLGLPVVAADIPANKEVSTKAQCTLYKSGNPTDLAQKIKQVIDNHQEEILNAQNSRKQIIKKLDRKICHQPVIDAIIAVKGKDNPRRENTAMISHFTNLNSGHKLSLERSEKYRQLVVEYREKYKQVEGELADIKQTVSWRAANKIKRMGKRK